MPRTRRQAEAEADQLSMSSIGNEGDSAQYGGIVRRRSDPQQQMGSIQFIPEQVDNLPMDGRQEVIAPPIGNEGFSQSLPISIPMSAVSSAGMLAQHLVSQANGNDLQNVVYSVANSGAGVVPPSSGNAPPGYNNMPRPNESAGRANLEDFLREQTQVLHGRMRELTLQHHAFEQRIGAVLVEDRQRANAALREMQEGVFARFDNVVQQMIPAMVNAMNDRPIRPQSAMPSVSRPDPPSVPTSHPVPIAPSVSIPSGQISSINRPNPIRENVSQPVPVQINASRCMQGSQPQQQQQQLGPVYSMAGLPSQVRVSSSVQSNNNQQRPRDVAPRQQHSDPYGVHPGQNGGYAPPNLGYSAAPRGLPPNYQGYMNGYQMLGSQQRSPPRAHQEPLNLARNGNAYNQPRQPQNRRIDNNGDDEDQGTAIRLRPTDIPKYSGKLDTRTPYDFLLELEKYQNISRSTDVAMIQSVVPLALTDQAYQWYRFEIARRPFESWNAFKVRFRREFQPVDYNYRLLKELEKRHQGQDELLSSYIRVVMDCYDRLDEQPREEEKIEFIKRRMNPEYRRALQGRRFATIVEFLEAASDADELMKYQFLYQEPQFNPNAEPFLQYRPSVNSSQPSRSSSPIRWRDMPSNDPPTFPSRSRQVSFDQSVNYDRERSTSESRYRAPSPAPPPASRVTNESPNRPRSPGFREPRRCHECQSTEHLRASCPVFLARRPENSRSPSPAGQGLGERGNQAQASGLSRPNRN